MGSHAVCLFCWRLAVDLSQKRATAWDVEAILLHQLQIGATLGSRVLLSLLCVLMHSIPHEGIKRDRQQARGVSPVFEELTLAVGQRVECVDRIGAKPGKRRDVVSADEHVHRVDLEGVELRCQLAEMPERGPRRSRTESL